jgi:hypothetical protein
MGWVSQATEKVSEAATQALQPIEKGLSQGITDLGRTIANSPELETAITLIAAYYQVPPEVTAGFLAANKTSQTGGNLEKGLETLVLSYGAGKLAANSFNAVDLSTPATTEQSVVQARTSAQTQAAADAATQAQIAAQAQATAAAEAQAVAAAQAQAAAVAEAQAATVAQAQAAAAAAAEAQAAVVAAEAQAAAAAQAQAVAAAQAQAAATTVVPAATTGGLLSGGAPSILTAGSAPGAIAATEAAYLAAPSAEVLAGAGLLGGAGLTPAAVTPAVTTPAAIANQAVASGMGPGALGATTAVTGGLTAAELAAASGTVGAGSALEGLATLGNTSALTNLLSQGSGVGSTLSSFLPSLLTGGLQGLGAANTAEKAREAAQIQAAAQVEAARIAADAAKFRPVGVTTRFGASNFTTDAQGNVIGAGYTASPEIQAYQNRLSALAAQGLTGAEGAQAAYAPLTAGAQSLFNLGQGYIQQTPEQQAADYIAKQQALLAPGQERQLAQLQNTLLAQGRGGLSVAQGGNLMATNPELAAYYNALAQSNLTLAAQGQQAGQQQAQFGAGLLGAGSDLMGKYYAGQTAAYAPFATAIDTTSGLENLAQQPMTLGTQIGAKTTASAAEAGRLLGQGMINSAATQAPVNAFSYSGNLFSQAANNPQLQAAILKAFST